MRSRWIRPLVGLSIVAGLLAAVSEAAVNPRDDGYRGIWFTLGQLTEHGDKYSGGLATYTANHVPLAVYAFWADGNPDKFLPSRLYFTNREGDRTWRLPYDMKSDFASPEPLDERP